MSLNTSLKSEVQHKLGNKSVVSTPSSTSITNTLLHKTIHAAGHDLRSPLFVIRSYGNLLQKTQEKERLKRGFKLMEEATYKMEKTINEFVGLIDIYTLPFPEKEMVSFQSAYDSARFELANIFNEKQFKISVDFDKYPQVSFNTKYLINIMAFLIDNAIRHNREKEDLQIVVTTKKIDGNIVLVIQDNGKGIENGKEQEKIKDAFYSYSDHPECMGMGLAKVQAIAQVSQNVFQLQSRRNEFTSCHFIFNA